MLVGYALQAAEVLEEVINAEVVDGVRELDLLLLVVEVHIFEEVARDPADYALFVDHDVGVVGLALLHEADEGEVVADLEVQVHVEVDRKDEVEVVLGEVDVQVAEEAHAACIQEVFHDGLVVPEHRERD